MTPILFLTELSTLTKLPIRKGKDFHYIESNGITVIEQFHKIGIVTTTNTETSYVTPSRELVQILATTMQNAAQSHQRRITDERETHLKQMTKRSKNDRYN